ncbi:Mannose glucose-specific lectin [Musa troglodytarum]|nr:Mannose glucose-specific lectin [Musa troglodytarum]
MAIRYKLPPSHLSSSPTSASVEEREEFGAHSTMNGAIKVGAWGGNGGSAYDMGPAYRIISVTVFSGDVVDAVDVTFTYYGKTETRHCGGSGGNPHEIVLEEDEYLVGMAGEVASYHGVVVCRRGGRRRGHHHHLLREDEDLTLRWHRKPWPRGRAVHLRSTPRSEPWRSAISCVHPISPSSPTSASVEEREEFGAHSTMNGAIKVGAWGGNGGSAFDMGPAYRIISVKIFSGDVIDAVDVTFTYYGKTETRHFGGSGGNPHELVLEEDEYLVGMAGEVASYHGVVVVGKLGLITNKKAYGPFGNTGGTPFSLPIAAGKISGFFGRDGQFLDAIGVYLEP